MAPMAFHGGVRAHDASEIAVIVNSSEISSGKSILCHISGSSLFRNSRCRAYLLSRSAEKAVSIRSDSLEVFWFVIYEISSR